MVKLIYTNQEKQDNKAVVWFNSIGDKKEIDHISNCYEDSVPKNKISTIKLFLCMISIKRFYWFIDEAIKYALRHHGSYAGEGASEVLLFRGDKNFQKIWKPYKEKPFNHKKWIKTLEF